MDGPARLAAACYRLAVPLAGAVPPRVAYPVIDRLADLMRLTAAGPRAAVEANVAQVLGATGASGGATGTVSGRRRHAWAVAGVFRHAVRNYYDTFRLPSLSDSEIRETVEIGGLPHLQRALANGRGAILFTAHVGSVALAAQALALAERGGIVVVEAVEPPELLDLMLRTRGSHGLDYRVLGPGQFGELTATLAGNELVFLVVDRDVSGTGVPLNFFGRPTSLPIGPALLHLRTGAPLIPAYVSRRHDGRLNGILGPAIDHAGRITPSGSRRHVLIEITRVVTSCLEYHIGRHPDQWTVLQRVWT